MAHSANQGLEIHRLMKVFDGVQAVDGVSFQVEPGAIYGLLGPNGAGKTTIIRIVMGILGADEGEVRYQGHPITRLESRRFGYLPEERGLYQKTRLRETLIYLARLKGLARPEAAGRVDAYLERFELQEYAQKNIQALSRGNQQKAQFIAAIVHQPEVVILDEPFAGLDPVNQIILKEIISELQAGGATILLSTHQMEQAQRLCDRLILINRGHKLIEGTMEQIRSRFSSRILLLEGEGDFGSLAGCEGVLDAHFTAGHARLEIAADTDPNAILRRALWTACVARSSSCGGTRSSDRSSGS